MSKTFHVAIVEDDDPVRRSVQTILAGSRNLRVTGAYGDAESALRQLPQRAPDLVLMDIDLPGMSGIECLQILKAILPRVRVMMVTAYGDEDKLFRSLQAGADGYWLKPSTPQALLEAVRGVLAGGAPISPPMARRMIDYFQNMRTRELKTPAAPVPLPEMARLTAREQQVLQKLAEGVTVKEISTVLNISWETVRAHIAKIYDKLHVHSRTEAVLKYLGRSGPGVNPNAKAG